MTAATPVLPSPLSDPAIVEDPYPTYEHLANVDPVHWWADVGAWAVMRYEDCKNAFADPVLSAERMRSVLGMKFPTDRLSEDSIYFHFVDNVVMYTDDPLHALLRDSVTPAFSRTAHEHYDAVIRDEAYELVNALEDTVELDVVPDLALRMPSLTANRVFGVPEEDIDFVVQRVTPIMSYWSGPRAQPMPLAGLLDELNELHDYARRLVSGERGAPPAHTAFGRLLETPPNVPLQQVLHQVVLTLMALFAPTTPGSISSGLLSFARNPEQIAKLRESNDGGEAAADEIFRYNASNQFTWRVSSKATQLGDVQIKADEVVALFIGSANHDASVFDRPHEFQIDRPNSRKHLTFGAGTHSCLGRRIAHCQVKWLVTALLSRFPTIELIGKPVWNENLEFRSLSSLPVRCTTRPS